MTSQGLEIRHPRLQDAQPLCAFFSSLSARGDEALFHPHPLNNSEAQRICAYSGQDLYYVITENLDVLGYGMLRGWDTGHTVPSLGIAISLSARGHGLGTLLVQFLHTAAKRRGAKKVMLKVYKSNMIARNMYEKLGYKLVDTGSDHLVGNYLL